MVITRSCPNLKEFRAVCVFDPRYIGFVGDEPLVSVSVNFPNSRADPEFEGFTPEDTRITVTALIEFFSGLPLLEELALDVCNNVRESSPALETLKLKCPKLGQFHGISMPVESKWMELHFVKGLSLCQLGMLGT
ncbi:hypothetical protein ACH5RR_037118 [Cinchona calisaya]|uniref:Uncharacterized protein n=1 Tax=Cinchona calisaya TaxID=153742 RepID=A0ABD2Y9L6_9GENT